MTPELQLLQVYAQLHHLQLDSQQLAHQFAQFDKAGQVQHMGVGDVVLALQTLGFEAHLVKGKRAELARAQLPALAPTRSGGLVLVGAIKDEPEQEAFVLLQEAGATQPCKMRLSDFDAMYAGQWIAAERKVQVPGAVAGAKSAFGIGWFWQALRKYRGLLGEVLLASLFVQVLALITPLVFQVVIDKVLTHRTLSTLDVMVIALAAVSIFEVVLGAMRHYLLSHTTNRVDVELGARLFQHLLHLPLSYFSSRKSGDTVARVRELENARNFLTGQALTGWLDLLFAVVYLGVMLYYSVTLTLVVLLALPIFFGASAIISPLLRKKLEDKFALGAENQNYLVETVTSMETLKSHAVEPHWQREWERRMAAHAHTAFEGGHLGNATNQFIGLASKLLAVVLLWLGARLVIDGDLTVGALIAFNMLSARVNAPILKLSSLYQDFTQMKVSIRRLADIMDAVPEPTFEAGCSLPPPLQGSVTFEHVSFSYGPNLPEVLKDISVDVKPGEVIGLVGVSGAGKTTLTRLIQRLYCPTAGRILLDGMDINLMDTAWLRRQMGVVGQDTLLFNRTVRENIALANPGLTMEQVMEAAKLAGAHEFIARLPQGYDTVIGERGSMLSGGQRARVAIARALVTQPRLLLLDEATAALDYESERAIHDNLAEIAKGRTVFMVAHRLSTLRLADRILVLENGHVVETGRHASLMAQGGRYASLYKAHQALDHAQGLEAMGATV